MLSCLCVCVWWGELYLTLQQRSPLEWVCIYNECSLVCSSNSFRGAGWDRDPRRVGCVWFNMLPTCTGSPQERVCVHVCVWVSVRMSTCISVRLGERKNWSFNVLFKLLWHTTFTHSHRIPIWRKTSKVVSITWGIKFYYSIYNNNNVHLSCAHQCPDEYEWLT